MKKLFKYVTPILVALISITVLFPAISLAVNTNYSITYEVSPAELNTNATDYISVTSNTCKKNDSNKSYTDPAGCTAYAQVGSYKFVKWIVKGSTSNELPAGWSTDETGSTLSFDPSASKAERKKENFVAVFELIEESPTEPSDSESIEVLKVSATKVTETVDKLEKGKEEILVTEAKEETTEDETTTETPETGDNNSTVVWIIIGAVALAAVIIAVIVLLTNKNKK